MSLIGSKVSAGIRWTRFAVLALLVTALYVIGGRWISHPSYIQKTINNVGTVARSKEVSMDLLNQRAKSVLDCRVLQYTTFEKRRDVLLECPDWTGIRRFRLKATYHLED